MNQAERIIKRMSEYAAIGLVTIETMAQLKFYMFIKAIHLMEVDWREIQGSTRIKVQSA